MEIKLARENLLIALRHVEKTSSTHLLPICSYVMFEANGDDVSITSTDLSGTTRFTIKGQITVEGLAMVELKKLIAAAAALEDDVVRLKTVNFEMIVTCGDAKVKLQTRDPEDFPEIPVLANCVEYTIEGKLFKEVVAKAAYSIDRAMHKVGTLDGVKIDIGKQITTWGADGYRVAMATCKLNNSGEERSFIIPPSTIAAIRGVGDEDELKIQIEGLRVRFVAGPLEIISSTLSGEYPKIKELFVIADTRCETNRLETIKALKLCGLLKQDLVRIIVEKEAMTLQATTPVDELVEAKIKCQAVEHWRFAVSAKYLREMLDHNDSETIVWGQQTKDQSPLTFTDGEGGHMIMPMFVMWDEEVKTTDNVPVDDAPDPEDDMDLEDNECEDSAE